MILSILWKDWYRCNLDLKILFERLFGCCVFNRLGAEEYRWGQRSQWEAICKIQSIMQGTEWAWVLRGRRYYDQVPTQPVLGAANMKKTDSQSLPRPRYGKTQFSFAKCLLNKWVSHPLCNSGLVGRPTGQQLRCHSKGPRRGGAVNEMWANASQL